MANVINQNSSKPAVPVAEQTRLIEFIIELIKAMPEVGSLPVSLNFVDTSTDMICVRLSKDTYKIAEYVDGSYEAQLAFSVIYRMLQVTGVDERLAAIDLVNRIGGALEAIEVFDTGIEGVEVSCISQKESAGLLYRDNSGIEDNGASFILRYDKN